MKREAEPPSGEYLAGINAAADIFSLEHTIQELMADTQKRSAGNITMQNSLVENTAKYIHSHLADPLSLETIAEHLHISPSHLSRTFKKTCGESLIEYINNTRIEKAKEYLLKPDILTYEAANLVGYNDAAYFSSTFKKLTGLSPTEYRAKMLGTG